MGATVFDELVRQYPQLVRPEVVIGCLHGWRELVERTLDEIIATGVHPSEINIRAIGEKHGRLRISASAPADRPDLGRVIVLAALRSQYVCEVCGEAGRTYQTPDGWRMSRCEQHAADCPLPLTTLRPVTMVEMMDGVWAYERSTDRLVRGGGVQKS